MVCIGLWEEKPIKSNNCFSFAYAQWFLKMLINYFARELKSSEIQNAENEDSFSNFHKFLMESFLKTEYYSPIYDNKIQIIVKKNGI